MAHVSLCLSLMSPPLLCSLAAAGDPFAQHWLGALHMTGIGGAELDRSLARHFLRLSLQHPPQAVSHLSAFLLGGLLHRGDGGEQDVREAARFYQHYVDHSLPTAQFHAEAQCRLAVILMQEQETDEDARQRAMRLLRAASGSGHAEAMLLLANAVLQETEGGHAAARKQRLEEARELMRRAQATLERELEEKHGRAGAQRLMLQPDSQQHDGDDDDKGAAETLATAQRGPFGAHKMQPPSPPPGSNHSGAQRKSWRTKRRRK